MQSVKFYQVKDSTPAALEGVLPLLLGKVHQAGSKAVVQCHSSEQVHRLNELLWTHEPTSFLPHGSKADGDLTDQPIALTDQADNPNNSTTVVRLAGTSEEIAATPVEHIIELFTSGEAQTFAARKRWLAYRDVAKEMAFFAQSEQGWQKRQ